MFIQSRPVLYLSLHLFIVSCGIISLRERLAYDNLFRCRREYFFSNI
jgi:hypothetical protein